MIIGLLALILLVVAVVLGVRKATGHDRRAPTDGHAVRRFFQYLVLYGLLVVTAFGLSGLLGRVLDPEAFIIDESGLALSLAFTVVGLPLYTALALWSRRTLRTDPAEAESLAWAAFVTLAALTSLALGMDALSRRGATGGGWLLRCAGLRLLDAGPGSEVLRPSEYFDRGPSLVDKEPAHHFRPSTEEDVYDTIGRRSVLEAHFDTISRGATLLQRRRRRPELANAVIAQVSRFSLTSGVGSDTPRHHSGSEPSGHGIGDVDVYGPQGSRHAYQINFVVDFFVAEKLGPGTIGCVC